MKKEILKTSLGCPLDFRSYSRGNWELLKDSEVGNQMVNCIIESAENGEFGLEQPEIL